jgi:hypothetical protein
LIGAWATYYATQREAQVKMIEIAVGILAAKPEDSIKPGSRVGGKRARLLLK